jgi:hypothetical protein
MINDGRSGTAWRSATRPSRRLRSRFADRAGKSVPMATCRPSGGRDGSAPAWAVARAVCLLGEPVDGRLGAVVPGHDLEPSRLERALHGVECHEEAGLGGARPRHRKMHGAALSGDDVMRDESLGRSAMFIATGCVQAWSPCPPVEQGSARAQERFSAPRRRTRYCLSGSLPAPFWRPGAWHSRPSCGGYISQKAAGTGPWCRLMPVREECARAKAN